MLQRLMFSAVCLGALMGQGCGAPPVDADDSPGSPDNLLAQASLLALQEITQDDDAEVGATTPPESLRGRSGDSACLSTRVTPGSLDPNDLPTDYSIAWHFEACPLTRGAVQSGDRWVTVSHERPSRTRVLSTARNLTLDAIDGGQLTVRGTDSMTATGLRREGAVTRTVESSSTRVRLHGDGTTAYHLTATYTLGVQDTYKGLRLTQRVGTGTGTLEHKLSGARTQVTFEALEFSPTCCYPVSGSLLQVTAPAGGTPKQKTFVFTSTCGHVLVNNRTAVTYPRCER